MYKQVRDKIQLHQGQVLSCDQRSPRNAGDEYTFVVLSNARHIGSYPKSVSNFVSVSGALSLSLMCTSPPKGAQLGKAINGILYLGYKLPPLLFELNAATLGDSCMRVVSAP